MSTDWTCSGCGRHFSPFITECPYCGYGTAAASELLWNIPMVPLAPFEETTEGKLEKVIEFMHGIKPMLEETLDKTGVVKINQEAQRIRMDIIEKELVGLKEVFYTLGLDEKDLAKMASEAWHNGERVGKLFAEVGLEEKIEKIQEDQKKDWKLLHEIRNRLDSLEKRAKP